MRLVFDNARRFNPAGTDVFVMAGDVEVSTPILPTSPWHCRASLFSARHEADAQWILEKYVSRPCIGTSQD